MGFFRTRNSFINIITNLGLTGNLQLCLDAGDSNSYDPAVQTDKWLDTSGNGYDFFRGSGTGGDAADPTFNGNAGNLTSNEYWSFDGGDYFTYDSANETWMQNLHKDNANFTIAMWWNAANKSALNMLFGTFNGDPALVGVRFFVIDNLALQVGNGTGVLSYSGSAGPSAITGLNFTAVSLNEATGANGAIFFNNGTSGTTNSTYTTPSSANAASTMRIATDDTTNILPNGCRTEIFCSWSTALTVAQLKVIAKSIGIISIPKIKQEIINAILSRQ